MINHEKQIEIARELTHKLERLSADSSWAHHASGLRGSLLKLLDENINSDINSQSNERFNQLASLIEIGFQILENAAREINYR
jgi:hypothetical protein